MCYISSMKAVNTGFGILIVRKREKKMKTLLFAITVLFVTGCASLAPLKVPQSTDKDESGRIKVIVARNWNYIGGMNLNWLTFDGENIVGMYTREFTEFTTTAGAHKIGVRWGSSLFGYAHMEKEIDLARDETRYFLITSSLFGAEIEEVPESELVKRVALYRFSPPGSTSTFHLY